MVFFSIRSLRFTLLLLNFFLVSNVLNAQIPVESVFHVNRGKTNEWISHKSNDDALQRIINNAAFQYLEKRQGTIDGLKTKSDWLSYRDSIKNILISPLSKFEKTPLNPQITGTIEREAFRVEKIIFESHPGFYVTASLFLPNKRQDPAPAIIFTSGHTSLGFRSKGYQHVILNLVSKGFIVMAFDPIGQGERLQYLDSKTGNSLIGGPTLEHSYAGAQALLWGVSLSDYFIWDGIRVVDYLYTRPEVDVSRIGITGRSGGGTQTAMIAACDERIYAAAPEAFITNYKRLLQSVGVQDAEQNLYNGISKGIDHPDFLHVRMPKPSLIITTINDFFSIQGARETFDEVKKSYVALGKGDNVEMVEDMGKHESTKLNRMAMYGFFQKHLSLPGDSNDIEIEPFPVEDLWSTQTGQLSSSLKCKTVFNLNREYASKKGTSEFFLPEYSAELAGIKLDRKLSSAVFTGKIVKDGMEVEKYFLENTKGDYALPVYVATKADSKADKVLLWLHPKGKEIILESTFVNELMDKGYTVVSADLPGMGELSNPDFSGDGIVEQVPLNYLFGANLVGKSITGIQAESIDLIVEFIHKDTRNKKRKLHAMIENSASFSFLHYIALKNPFDRSVVINQYLSGPEGITKEYYNPEEAFFSVPGSLPYYKLLNLVELHPKHRLKIIKTPLSEGGVKESLNFFAK
ncbi:acetylxylan esterase [Maribacter sp. ANRC-HE7]|uniref:Acetylxylan esterase n=1 Tax=Maribacter aquimaris TaxID=2737171 RepID=A0ABR7V1R9_9FLAO|nr:acetylxylan esterase [Maribacter aquimaris]MBD0778255.1 acetylxylan esterase [Maribacter aquimaris]